MSSEGQGSQQLSATEVRTVRVLNATREQVFDAWVDPAKLTRWWGPNGFTSTFHLHEPRPGGAWRFTFVGPDGREYHNQLQYLEVEAPSRIVLHHVNGPVYWATVTFEAVGEQTRLTWQMRFDNPRFLADTNGLIPRANEENLDRLEAVLGLR